MPAPTDPASAARRVVASLADGVMPSVNDLFALLPVLDVIARERAEDRVGPFDLPELPRPAVCYADHSFPAYSAQQIKDFARAAIALADAEAAARKPLPQWSPDTVERIARDLCADDSADPDEMIYPGITMPQGYTKPSGPPQPRWTFRRQEAIERLNEASAPPSTRP